MVLITLLLRYISYLDAVYRDTTLTLSFLLLVVSWVFS